MTAVGYLCAIQPQRMEGLMNAEKVHLAEAIDTWVLSVLNQGGGDEQNGRHQPKG